MTRAGIELRRNIRAELDAHPDMSPADLRRTFKTTPDIVASALGKRLDEWTALLDAAPAITPIIKQYDRESTASPNMPGLEQGIVKFTRKPAKMGEDFIFWIPRVYIKNGLVDPSIEYEIFLKKKQA
jgi:hypothetical protein